MKFLIILVIFAALILANCQFQSTGFRETQPSIDATKPQPSGQQAPFLSEIKKRLQPMLARIQDEVDSFKKHIAKADTADFGPMF